MGMSNILTNIYIHRVIRNMDGMDPKHVKLFYKEHGTFEGMPGQFSEHSEDVSDERKCVYRTRFWRQIAIF